MRREGDRESADVSVDTISGHRMSAATACSIIRHQSRRLRDCSSTSKLEHRMRNRHLIFFCFFSFSHVFSIYVFLLYYVSLTSSWK